MKRFPRISLRVLELWSAKRSLSQRTLLSGPRPPSVTMPSLAPSLSTGSSKTRLGKTGLSLTVLTNVRARSRRLFVLPRLYRESRCRRSYVSLSVSDVFPRLQVTKARRRTTFSLEIIARLKGPLGYVCAQRMTETKK